MNIYVGNLPFDATEPGLRSLFADYGTMTSAAVITERNAPLIAPPEARPTVPEGRSNRQLDHRAAQSGSD